MVVSKRLETSVEGDAPPSEPALLELEAAAKRAAATNEYAMVIMRQRQHRSGAR